MTNETTYLENLLNNRKVVRSYQKAKVDKNSLEKIAKNSIKIPTAGFSRGIEILNTFDVAKIKIVSEIFNENSFKKDNQSPWISNSLALFFLMLNEDEYHKRYSSSDKKNAVNSKEWDVPYWYVDAGAALMNCLLLIEEQGFASGFMGLHNIDRKKVHDLFKIPNDYQIVGMITAGVEDSNVVSSKEKSIKKKLTHNEFFSK
jgi:nitroreductase|tara:strand:+ start:305 stop:910 length:606 start_codon:yes stop_codon:yes gene_type:complete